MFVNDLNDTSFNFPEIDLIYLFVKMKIAMSDLLRKSSVFKFQSVEYLLQSMISSGDVSQQSRLYCMWKRNSNVTIGGKVEVEKLPSG